MDIDSDDDKKPLVIFGRDVSKIPCFRNSFLYGIGGGFASGLAMFLLTSRPQLSTNSAVGMFALTTICYWSVCRLNYSQEKFRIAQLQLAMKKQALYEGTAIEREVMERGKEA